MPWSGSGAFNRLYSWVADANAGIKIIATRMDADTDDITANGFGNCLTRDGQGSATANQPMNGYRHTGVGNGVAATDYVAVGQLKPAGNAPAVGIYGIAALGDIKPTAIPEAVLPAGWYVCAGQTRPRTDPLWLATGAIDPSYWLWGNGDSSTTYTLPDLRGRGLFGKDDMGGSAANRITNAVAGVAGNTLAATGGDQHAQTDTIAVNVAGSITLTGTIGVTDLGHSHDTVSPQNQPSASDGSNNKLVSSTGGTTGVGYANLSVTNTLGISNTQTITASGNLSGSSQNIPPAAIVNLIIFAGA